MTAPEPVTPRADGAPSRPERGQSYEALREFYRSDAVAADYDRHRFASPWRAWRNRRQWQVVREVLAEAEGVRRVLDLPCGTGRFTADFASLGLEVVGADVSVEMMRQARGRAAAARGVRGFVQADALALPFRDGAFDCVACIRFTQHVPPDLRVRMLAEMRRVATRWLLVEYRHRHGWKHALGNAAAALGLRRRKPHRRVTRTELEDELHRAGFVVRRVRATAPLFSDKWIVLCERA